MKIFRLIAVALFSTALFSVSAAAQTTPAAPAEKVGVVFWSAFSDEANGIKKYTAAIKALDLEFEPLRQDLTKLGNSYAALQKELQGFQDLAAQNKPIPISNDDIRKKADQLAQMERDIKFKQEDAKAKYEARQNAVLGPVTNDILKALNDYTVAKGYWMILEGGKLDEQGLILGLSQKADVTKDFITYFNSRPATSTAPVK